MSAKKISDNSNVFVLTQEEISSQDPVYNLMKSVTANQILPWANSVYDSICMPNVDMTCVIDANQFAKNLALVSEKIQRDMQNLAPSWLKLPLEKRKKNIFTTRQYGLAVRVRNIVSMFLSLYLRKQWQQVAIFSIFFNVVEKEVYEDYNRKTEKEKIYNSFQICQDGYDVLYNRSHKTEASIGDQVELKLQHAGFGRLLIWATKLFYEMKDLVQKKIIDPQVLYAPIYLHLKQENLSAILEFFMRQMYVYVCENIESIAKQDSQFKDINLTHVQKYFNASKAIARHLLLSSKLTNSKQAKKAQDSDCIVNDKLLLCGDTEYSPTCFPHNRLIATNLQITETLSLFAVLRERNYSLFGSESVNCESSFCLWLVWLQNVERLYYMTDEKRRDPEAQKLFTGTIKPKHFRCIMDMLREFIVAHSSVLLQETGFDMNHEDLLQKLLARINLLCDFYSIVNLCIHERRMKQ